MSDASSPLAGTSSQTVGPFFSFGLSTNLALGRLAAAGAPGEHIRLRVRVTDGDGAAVRDALVEVWQADHNGQYVEPSAAFRGFGRLGTDADGGCTFETIRPGPTPQGQSGQEASHVNVCLFMRGLLRHVYTRIYFDGDPAQERDPVLALVPADRRRTLMATPVAGSTGDWTFEIRLQGDHETVFFDL